HTLEDIFYFMREEKPKEVDCTALSDYVLDGVDFIKVEVEKIKNGDAADGDASVLIQDLKDFLTKLKAENCNTQATGGKEKVTEKKNQQYYISQEKVITTLYRNRFKAVVFFEEGCEMENIRAYTIIHTLSDLTDDFYYIPEDIIDSDESIEIIQKEGFQIYLKTNASYDEVSHYFEQTVFLKHLELTQLENEDEQPKGNTKPTVVLDSQVKIPTIFDCSKGKEADKTVHSSSAQSIISVSVAKLDKLLDLVGEMVIAEAMVTQNPDILGLELENFHKAARQLNKITTEMQDTVMSIRMVPLSTTFQKMNRIVRDMCKQLRKEVKLEIIGEETEVDKNIIEHISDPLMHLVRNAIDHGIEASEERLAGGKEKAGTVTLEAKNSGSDVLVIVRDDGKGLDKDRILSKALQNGMLHKRVEDMTDREIFNLILLPGFSTKESVSEFSGRGVGMDVVAKNIEMVGGTLSVDSAPNQGTTMTLKIPLTLAIIDGMNVRVGNSCYTIPTISIKESLKPHKEDIITDPDGNEMIMLRGNCYPILRLHECYHVATDITDFTDGIIMILEQDDRSLCIFVEELLGQQQVVVKSLPAYIQKLKKIKGLAGCTLLGDGSISLILDIIGLFNLTSKTPLLNGL
ncbi:MAG TPA: chemotaxis protein CheA, partial [Lachnospiraceae bacterium]|nr:chemotaxis protein CheA [Lachnospiraceae bacterium]